MTLCCILPPSVAGWEKSSVVLMNALHVGDKLMMVNQQMLNSAGFAQDTITMTGKEQVNEMKESNLFVFLLFVFSNNNSSSFQL